MKDIMKKYRKAKGFTLIELLIVIIIIGILAGMMMLSIGSATDKAQAAKIISNMRNLKAACVMYYADTDKWPGATTAVTFAALGGDDSGEALSLDKYLDRQPGNLYGVTSGDGSIFVTFKPDGTITTGIKQKLTDSAKNSGLYSEAKSNSISYYNNGDTVYMPVAK